MAVNSNLHNIRALIVGATCEFSFAEAPSTATLAQIGGPLYPYKDFGNLSVLDVTSEMESEKRVTAFRGVRREISSEPTLTRLMYKLKSNEADPTKLAIAFNASEGGAFTQGALSAVVGQALDFTTAPAVIGQWYQLRTVGGVAVRNVTTVTIPTLVLNTDFVIDGDLGRIRFLTSQAASRTPTITASAVTADPSALAMNILNPMQKPIRRGYGRITLFDRDATNKVVLDHYDFTCELVLEGSGLNSQDGKAAAETSLMITVTDQVGVMLARS
jgi:hypothetical protein